MEKRESWLIHSHEYYETDLSDTDSANATLISTIYVDLDSEPEALKKLFRKKLMTGGAVLRLSPDLQGDDFFRIFDRFAPQAMSHNLCSMVLVELAKSPKAPPKLKDSLAALGLANLG